MALIPSPATDPLVSTEQIVDDEGRPTFYFQQQWAAQQGINISGDAVIAAVTQAELDIATINGINLIAGNGISGGGDLSGDDRTFSLTDAAYDLGIFLPGVPTDAQLLMQYVFDRTVIFTDDFAGSTGLVDVNPAAAATINVLKNDVDIGTISITTGGVVTFVTTASDIETFDSGDKLTLVAQDTADATLSDISITFKGVRTFA